MHAYDHDYFEELDPQDEAVTRAETVLKSHFLNIRKKPIKTPFYLKQLQVFYERDYFPWVLRKALNNLQDNGTLGIIRLKDLPQRHKIKNIQDIKFYYNSQISENHLSVLSVKAFNVTTIVDQYSNPIVARHLGEHLESLVTNELRAQQFKIDSRNSNEFKGRKWTKSNKDLDIIASHKVKNLNIGVEIKNTLEIIPRHELDEKIEICKFLGLTPVFAVRWLKPYIHHITQNKGFAWIFKTQMYPLGYESLVNLIYNRLSTYSRKSQSIELQFPVSIRKELPLNSVIKFENWINRFD